MNRKIVRRSAFKSATYWVLFSATTGVLLASVAASLVAPAYAQKAVPGVELQQRGPYGNCSGASGACNAAGGSDGAADFKKFKDKFKKVAKNKAKICDIIVYFEADGATDHMAVVAALNADGTPKLTLGQNGSPPSDSSISPNKKGNVTLNPVATYQNNTKPVEDKDWNVYTPNDDRNPTDDIIQAQKDANKNPNPQDATQRDAWLKLLKLCHDRNLAVFNSPAAPKEVKKEEEKTETPKETPTQKESGDIKKSSKFMFPGFGYYSRPGGNTYTVTFTGDSMKQCTYDGAPGVPAPITFADDDGNPTETSFDPKTGELVPPSEPSKQTPETPTRTSEARPPHVPADTPSKTPVTETPRTPDTPQPTQTTDVPPTVPTTDDIPSTVFVKANEEVVQGGPTGQPLASQLVKLLAPRPALPGSGVSKTAQDTGFDKPPAQCTTGIDGRCKFEVPADERPVYGLPVMDTAVRRPNYRVEFNALKSSGGVAEITGRKPAAERAPAGGNLASDIFNIGNRIFQRFGFNTPYESREDVEASYRSAFGDRYQVDTCETKKLPGLPLGIEPSSFNDPSHELSQATIKLDRATRFGGSSR
jgi:hypothetical protein